MLRNLRDFYFRLDLRSLALFRILLGLLLIHDWSVRWPDLEAFYTSAGVHPIESPLPKAGGEFHFSILNAVTSLPMIQLLFVAGLVCYVLFLIGYKTRLFQILGFLFFVSVVNRNVAIRHGGDVAMVTMYMWSLFLPVAKRFSVDSFSRFWTRSRDPQALTGVSLASLAIVLQIAVLYFQAGFAKFGDTWKNGTALYYVFELDQYSNALGQWFLDRPFWIIKALTWGTLFVEFAALPLILLPLGQPLLRRLAILVLAGMHLGTWATMELGSFPFILMASYAVLLRPADWQLVQRLVLRGSKSVTAYYDDQCGFCTRCCQLIANLDLGGRVRFIGASEKQAFEHDVSKHELETSIVVFEKASGKKTTKSAGMAALLGALPWPLPLLRFIAWPGLSRPNDWLYDLVARNRHRLSAWLGTPVCGVRPDPPATRAPAPPTEGSLLEHARRITGALVLNGAVAVLLVSTLLHSYNMSMSVPLGKDEIREPRWVRAVVESMQLVHGWYLFAPDPLLHDGWWVLDGVTELGERRDPLTGKTPTWDKPKNLSSRYSVFWRKYLYSLSQPQYNVDRLYFARYIVRKYQAGKPPGERLKKFNFYYVRETTRPPGSPKPFPREPVLLWGYDHHTGKTNPLGV